MEQDSAVNEGEVDTLDVFAQARKVPLSHQVGNMLALSCFQWLKASRLLRPTDPSRDLTSSAYGQ